MFAANPSYIDMMLNDVVDAMIFKAALTMQAVGILIPMPCDEEYLGTIMNA